MTFPAPVECAPITLADTTAPSRRLHCRRYRQCLNIADERGWGNFSCACCPIDEPLSREELARDQGRLIECLAAAFERAAPWEG